MDEWMFWLIGAGLLVIAEMITGTFYLLMIAAGLCAGAIAAAAGATGAVQTIAAALVSLIATTVLRRSRFGKRVRTNPNKDRDVHIDIGQIVTVELWLNHRARAMYRGALWDIELRPEATEQAGQFRIVEVSSNRLIVEPVDASQK